MKKMFHNFLKSVESNPNTPPYSADIRESPISPSPKHRNILSSPPLYTTINTKYTQTPTHHQFSDMVDTAHVLNTGKLI